MRGNLCLAIHMQDDLKELIIAAHQHLEALPTAKRVHLVIRACDRRRNREHASVSDSRDPGLEAAGQHVAKLAEGGHYFCLALTGIDIKHLLGKFGSGCLAASNTNNPQSEPASPTIAVNSGTSLASSQGITFIPSIMLNTSCSESCTYLTQSVDGLIAGVSMCALMFAFMRFSPMEG